MTAELVVVKGRHRGDFVRIGATPVTIGRARSAQLPLGDDTKVSHVHARVTPMEGQRYVLEDLGSTNGTWVNEERIDQAVLRSGDLVKIGRSLLVFRADASSSVHLADVDLVGGGSSADIKSDPVAPPVASAAAPPLPLPPAGQGPPPPAPVRAGQTGRLVEAPPTERGAPRDQLISGHAVGNAAAALEDVALAAGAIDLGRGLERLADALVRGGAERALLFLRHPLTGGLGRAAARASANVDLDGAVVAELLARAAAGDVAVDELGAAAPVRVFGQPAGAVYVDGRGGDPGQRLRLLTAAGAVAGLLVAADRTRRLADAASEIVALAGERTQRRPVDLAAQLLATERVYERPARARGLHWELTRAPGPVLGMADPVLLGRGLDRLVEHVLAVARGDVRLELLAAGPEAPLARIRISRPLVEPPETVARLVDPDGVSADLRRARETLSDGGLAVARVSLLRAGARLGVQVEGTRVVHLLELEPAAAGRGGA